LVVIKLSTAPLHSGGYELQFLNYVKQILKLTAEMCCLYRYFRTTS